MFAAFFYDSQGNNILKIYLRTFNVSFKLDYFHVAINKDPFMKHRI